VSELAAPAPGTRPSRPVEVTRVLLILAALVVAVLPFAWILFGAFRTPADLTDPGSFQFHPTLENFSAISEDAVPVAALRSVIVGVAVTIVGVIIGSLGAYAISRFRTGGLVLRFGILLPTVIPPTVLVFPLLALALSLHLNDTLLAVIAAHLTYVVPMITWFMVGFFNGVPRELEEQAAIDGYGPFAAFLRVVIPNVLPGLGAAALLAFMLSWNELFYALILAPGTSRTLPVAIASFNTFQGVKLGPMCAAILIAAVPVTLLSFFIQRHLVRGMSGGGLKQ
jgi:ABC-type glycerol-3-phosphate transport system permease component